nr:helix-turn-helix domain-containing protein [Streptomyces lavenduligriseus]
MRLEAVERVGRREKNREIAAGLRVSERSVERWRRAWRERGDVGVLSRGSPGRRDSVRSRWTGWSVSWSVDHSPTAGRTSDGRRHGWSWQQLARWTIERDEEEAVELWKKEVWPRVRAPRRRAAAGSSSRTRPGSR